MTDDEWFRSVSPEPLLAFLRGRPAHPQASRIVFLYASACYRLNWDAHDPAIRDVIEMLEAKARNRTDAVGTKSFLAPLWTLFAGDLSGAIGQVLALSGAGVWAMAEMATQATRALGADPGTQAALLKELHAPPSLTPDSLNRPWRTEAVVSLASQIATHDEFHLIPVLGDMLWEAGCRDTVITDHCLGGTDHRRGCWVIEGLL